VRLGAEVVAHAVGNLHLGLKRQAAVVALAQRVVGALAEPYVDGGVTFPMSASVGAVVSGDSTASPVELLQMADAAMYVAKSGGRNRYEIAGAPS